MQTVLRCRGNSICASPEGTLISHQNDENNEVEGDTDP